MAQCLLSVGSNLGDRRQTLATACARLRQHRDLHSVVVSRWYSTRAVGGPAGQDDFLNGAVRLETSLQPAALLAELQAVESEFGRTRNIRWAARTLDIDLLLYGQQVIATAGLTVPHPRLSFRRFVLEPTAEIAADMPVPGLGQTIGQLLEQLNFSDDYVAVTGPIGVGKSRLAEKLARATGGRIIREPVDDAMLDTFYADPTGRGWATEIRFLRERVGLLRRGEGCALVAAESVADPPRLAISDFWFGQSLAFARTWLPPDELRRYEARWHKAHTEMSLLRPKLVVLLDAPSGDLISRIQQRGRPYEQHLTTVLLDALRTKLDAAIEEVRPGGVLRLNALAEDSAREEVLAAISAMQ